MSPNPVENQLQALGSLLRKQEQARVLHAQIAAAVATATESKA